MSFRLKTILGVAAIEAVLLALLVWSGLRFIERSAEQEFTQRAQATVRGFAVTAKGAVIASDLASLQSFVREALTYPGVVYARVRDADGRALVSAGDEAALARTFAPDADFGAVADGVFDAAGEIVEGGTTFGRVELGLSAQALRELEADARRYGIGLALLEMGLVALFSLALGVYLTRQLKNLTEGARQVAAGELGYQVAVRGRDELADVARAFNAMSARVRESYASLAAREAHLRRVLNSTQDAILVINAEGLIESFNAGAEAMFGYSAEEIIGRNVSVLVPPPHQQRHDDYLRRYRETGVPHILGVEREFEAQRRDGNAFPMVLRVNEMSEAGERRFIGVIHDITERKRIENALREAKDAAEAAAETKTQFLANMSHEIRTPMHGVLGSLEMLRDTPLSPPQQRYLDTANTSAEILLTLIDEVLDFSRLEAGKLHIETLDFELRRAVEDVTAMLGQRAHAKRLELACFIAPTVPDRLRGDPIRLRQIMTNLVGNAIKFTEHGEVVVSVTAERFEANHALLRFEVKDTGIGIPADKQPLLFQPFVQADGSTSRRFGGTGLGLSIARRLAELMGGEIGLESEPGVGSRFWFRLPFAVAGRGETGLRADFNGVRMLVVDDNATNRIILHRYLTAWGVQPGSAGSGEEALAKLQDAAAVGRPYPLVLLDFNMPGMDGLMLVKRLRQDPTLAGTRLLMLSSFGRDSAVADELGIDIWLDKPVRQSDLYDAIATILNRDDGRAPVEEARSVRPGAELHFAGERVLLVEDNLTTQQIGKAMLRQRGLEVAIASNGLEAVAALEREQYAIVLMDVQMPELDGFEATRRIRRLEAAEGRARTPIIALTAHALPADRQKCLDAGMDDYLVKPYSGASLSAIVARWLAPRLHRAAAAPENALEQGTFPLEGIDALEQTGRDAVAAAEQWQARASPS
jgi:PAS domain S-box-containing protein